MSEFSDWLSERRAEITAESGVRAASYRAIAARIGVAHNTVRMWALGKSNPEPENWPGIARAFRVDVELIRRLVGHSENPADDYLRQSDLDSKEDYLVKAYRSADELHRELLLLAAKAADGTRHDSGDADADAAV